MKPESAAAPTMTKLHEAIVIHLADAILSGVLPVGWSLPNENELAAAHGVSRTAAREAMQKLASLGLIESRRRKGATVLARDNWKLLDESVLDLAVLRVTDAAFFQSLVEARLLIEPRAAELAAQRASPADIACIEEALTAMASEADGARSAVGRRRRRVSCGRHCGGRQLGLHAIGRHSPRCAGCRDSPYWRTRAVGAGVTGTASCCIRGNSPARSCRSARGHDATAAHNAA